MYSVNADILGELRGRDEDVDCREPFREGTDVWEDISVRGKQLECLEAEMQRCLVDEERNSRVICESDSEN